MTTLSERMQLAQARTQRTGSARSPPGGPQRESPVSWNPAGEEHVDVPENRWVP